MSSPEACADIAIGNFVKMLGAPYWPNWAGLIPGDTTNGWNASKPDWRVQADSIMDNFELCCGVAIGRNKTDIDRLRSKTLSLFSDYLVEKASIAAATRAVQLAQEKLAALKASAKTFPVV